MKIAIGSTNPVKIEATKKAFKKVWPNKKWQVVGLEIPSGVSSQPMTDAESIKGATNRAKGALKANKADFAVGIEGGLQEFQGNWFDSGWVVIINKSGVVGIGSSIRMETPAIIIKKVKAGGEVGLIDNEIFKTKDSKKGIGHFGLMTDGAITRIDCYTQGVISALSRFIHPELF